MRALFANPELRRNWRAQLRPGRMIAAVIIAAVLSLALGFALSESVPAPVWGQTLLYLALLGQLLALTVGGSLSCLHAIQREKEMNTFDFQRVTRLTPSELTLGKLFGAPALGYFITLCLLPAAIVGAVVGDVRPAFFLAAYAVLLLGSITFHAFALMVSMHLERGSTAAAVLLILLVLWILSIPGGFGGVLALGELGPFFAPDLLSQTSWALSDHVMSGGGYNPFVIDLFFDQPVHHFFVLVVLYLTLTAWFLLAVTRNIKRDPTVYEVYTPAQSLGFILYLNFLLLAFFRWHPGRPFDDQGILTGLNLGLFFLLGLVLLRNRDRLRRRLRERQAGAANGFDVLWPAPYLLLGAVVVGAAIIGMVEWKRSPEQAWNLGLAIFRLAFFTAWLVRDVQYLQWMNLRTTRRPLVKGVLFLTVFYVVMVIVLASMDFFEQPERLPYTALFVPSGAFVDPLSWAAHPALWSVALALQVVAAGFFVYLQKRKLRGLSSPARNAPTLAARGL
ncbi:MAG: hypothetical protein V3U28_05030 [Candidatus Acidoferrales bacterium]